jgi:hypothetical protein
MDLSIGYTSVQAMRLTTFTVKSEPR